LIHVSKKRAENGQAVSHPAGQSWPNWLSASLAVAAVGWGANQFAPLLVVYRHDLGLSAPVASATFALYIVGLIPGLFVGGPLSDRRGRRIVMLVALVISLLGSVSLALGGMSVAWLLVGRLVSGFASGAAFSSGTAWIKELSQDPSGRADQNPGPRRATIAMSVGFAGGPLFASILAQWSPERTVVPYLPHLVLAIGSFFLVLRLPKDAPPNGRLSRNSEKMNPFDARRFRSVILPLAPWVFGVAAIGLVYLPGIVSPTLGHYALVYSGVVAALTALSGVFIQPLARRIDHETRPRLIAASLGICALGLMVGAVAAATHQPGLVIVSAIILGAGYGSCQVSGLLEVQRLATSRNLGALTAIYQAVTYTGFALPFILSALQPKVAAPYLLVSLGVLAILTLAWTVPAAIRNQAHDRSAGEAK
jgi:MFS family permease